MRKPNSNSRAIRWRDESVVSSRRARVERVLVEPADGRAAFVVLSFLDRQEMLALPWSALEIDARGRARLTAGREALERAPRFYGSRVGNALPSTFADPESLEGSEEPGTDLPSFRIVSGGEGMLRERVIGRIRRAGENGRGRAPRSWTSEAKPSASILDPKADRRQPY